MKFFFFLIFAFMLTNCSKPKTVLICGDHICVNKVEAEQFFQENLTLEVKILNKKKKKEVDLIELNLRESSNVNKVVSVTSKESTDLKLKTLSNQEIIKIKKELKDNKKKQINVKKKESNNKIVKKIKKNNKEKIVKEKILNVNNRKNARDVADVCSLIDKCNIEEISKFLLNQGKKKKFPDITKRNN